MKELAEAVSVLKKGKSYRTDGIINEIIISSFPRIDLCYLRIFNLIFANSTHPKSWRVNTLTPLHKKGSIHIRENYRGTVVSNCIANHFSSHPYMYYLFFKTVSMPNALPACPDITKTCGWNPLIRYMTISLTISWKTYCSLKNSLEWKIMFVVSRNLKEDISLN